ncbi:MAG: DUF5333 family protein [Pseudomonadota bacterium]
MNKHLSFVFCMALLGCASPAVPTQGPYAVAVPEIVATSEIVRQCPGLNTSFDVLSEGFVISAADYVAATDGLSSQRLRAPLFYANNTDLMASAQTLLSEQGVDMQDTDALCAYGRSVAGSNTRVGRLLAL